MFVYELVMRRTGQDQIAEVGPASSAPPPDVMRLREALGAARWEHAPAVAVTKLTDHPVRRLTRGAAEPYDVAGGVVDDALHPRLAHEPGERFGRHHPAAFDGESRVTSTHTQVASGRDI
jgi:hypothetical protein